MAQSNSKLFGQGVEKILEKVDTLTLYNIGVYNKYIKNIYLENFQEFS